MATACSTTLPPEQSLFSQQKNKVQTYRGSSIPKKVAMKQSLRRILDTVEELSEEGRLNSDTYMRLSNSLKYAFEESANQEDSALVDLYADMCGFFPYNVTVPLFGPLYNFDRDTIRAVFRKNVHQDPEWWSEVADCYLQLLNDRVFEVEHSTMYLADILISSKLIHVPMRKAMMKHKYCPMCHFQEDGVYPEIRMSHIFGQSTGMVMVCTSCENSQNHAIPNDVLLRKARSLVMLSELEEDDELAAAIGLRRSKRLRHC